MGESVEVLAFDLPTSLGAACDGLLEIFASFHGLICLVFQEGINFPDLLLGVKNIAAARGVWQGSCLSGTQAAARIGDDSIRGEAAILQFQEPHAPGIGIAMSFLAQQVAVGGIRIQAGEHGDAALENFVVKADANGAEILSVVVLASRRDDAADDVVNGADG